MPIRNIVTIDTISSAPRIHFFNKKCPAPGTSHPASKTTAACVVFALPGACAATCALVVISTSHDTSSNAHNLRLHPPGHLGPLGPRHHVDLAPHPELPWKINPRLHRKARIRQNQPL